MSEVDKPDTTVTPEITSLDTIAPSQTAKEIARKIIQNDPHKDDKSIPHFAAHWAVTETDNFRHVATLNGSQFDDNIEFAREVAVAIHNILKECSSDGIHLAVNLSKGDMMAGEVRVDNVHIVRPEALLAQDCIDFHTNNNRPLMITADPQALERARVAIAAGRFK